MAKLGDLVVRIGADTRNLNKSLGRVQRNIRSMTGNFKQLGQNMTRSITLPLVGIGAAALKSAADLETLETSFISLTGGVKEAKDMMKQLTAFTAKTPFQIDAVAKSARQLIASGTDISQVNEQLQFLGDIAATSGTSIDDIAAIFAKVNAKGKVELENLNQLAERGIPIFTALSEATGLPADELGAGAVSVQQFNEVLQSFAGEGGFAEGAMLRLSQTVSGKFSTALDNAKLAAASLGEQLLPIAGKILDGFTNLAQKFTELDAGTKQMIISVAAFAAALGPAILGITGLVSAITFLAGPIGIVILKIGAITAAIVMLYDDARPFIISLVNLFIDLYNNIQPLRVLIAVVRAAFLNFGKATFTVFRTVANSLSTIFKALRLALTGNFTEALNVFTSGFAEIGDDIFQVGKDIGTDLVQGITDAILAEDIPLLGEDSLPSRAEIMARLKSLFSGTGSVISEGIASGTAGVHILLTQLENIDKAIKPIIEEITESVNEMDKSIADAFGSAAASAESFAEGLVDVARQIIKQYLAIGVAKALASGNVVEAVALSVGAGLLDRIQVPALAQGGLAYGPTMAMVGDNRNAAIDPEVVAPLSKLKDMMGGGVVEVVGRIKGDDIFLSNARTARNRGRYA